MILAQDLVDGCYVRKRAGVVRTGKRWIALVHAKVARRVLLPLPVLLCRGARRGDICLGRGLPPASNIHVYISHVP